MLFAVAFFAFGACCAYWAWAGGGLAWLLLWPATAFFLVATGYAGAGPAVFGKRPDGRLAPWATALLAPFLLLNSTLWHLQRMISSERCCDEIVPGIWLGRRPLGNDVPPAVRTIIDLTCEFAAPRGTACNRTYVSVPVLDACAMDEVRLRELVERIGQTSDDVLICCAQGHGRSAMVAAAVLIRKGLAGNVTEAEALLRASRPKIRLSPRQRRLVARLVPEASDTPARPM